MICVKFTAFCNLRVRLARALHKVTKRSEAVTVSRLLLLTCTLTPQLEPALTSWDRHRLWEYNLLTAKYVLAWLTARFHTAPPNESTVAFGASLFKSHSVTSPCNPEENSLFLHQTRDSMDVPLQPGMTWRETSARVANRIDVQTVARIQNRWEFCNYRPF